ncbi:MAG: hypothetical protein LBK71_12265 [Verrucomicrobiales bacterium]|nr:hypothetical protein [Verrucomicrobiales bacterium]
MACATPQPELYPMPGETPPTVSGKVVTISQENVRLPETVKKYEFGSYVWHGKRYGAGAMHTVEQSAAWNLQPGTDTATRAPDPTKLQTPTRAEVEEGPLDAAPELPARNVQMSAQLEQELARQKQISRALSEQLDAQRQLTVEWQKTQDAAAVILGENQRLKNEVAALKAVEAERRQKAAEMLAKKSESSWFSWFSKAKKSPAPDADGEEQ